MDDKGRARGLKPPIDEHAAILRALKQRDPEAARAAMHEHISRVIEQMLEAPRWKKSSAPVRWRPKSAAATPGAPQDQRALASRLPRVQPGNRGRRGIEA
jgi:hypothetical protein